MIYGLDNVSGFFGGGPWVPHFSEWDCFLYGSGRDGQGGLPSLLLSGKD